MCTVVVLVFIDGLMKRHFPGSLREPAPTQLFPHHWSTLPLSFGLFMGKLTQHLCEIVIAESWKLHGAGILSFQVFIVICGILTSSEKVSISLSLLQ